MGPEPVPPPPEPVPPPPEPVPPPPSPTHESESSESSESSDDESGASCWDSGDGRLTPSDCWPTESESETPPAPSPVAPAPPVSILERSDTADVMDAVRCNVCNLGTNEATLLLCEGCDT